MQLVSSVSPTAGDDGYAELIAEMRKRLQRDASEKADPWFLVSGEGLYDLFLSQLPSEARPTYECRACRAFVDSYGGLVRLGTDGVSYPILWPTDDAASPMFQAAMRSLRAACIRRPVESAFVPGELVFGRPSTLDAKRGRTWEHFSLTVGESRLWRKPLQTASQRAAEIREDVGMLRRATLEYSPQVADAAFAFLQGDSLYRGEKVAGAAQWFAELARRVAPVLRNTSVRDKMLWLAAATAPPGFAHIRGGMLGTLMDDVKAGLPPEVIRAKFREKMDPLKYQRPTAEVSAGQVVAAEKAVQALQSAGALSRRYAQWADIPEWLWTPPAPKPQTPQPQAPQPGGVFGHLVKGQKAPGGVTLTASTSVPMTFAKFRRDVLPSAETIEVSLPSSEGLISLVTAADPEAPPILQWDSPERRNPVSWYFPRLPDPVQTWGLKSGWVPVSGVTLFPTQWFGRDYPQDGAGAIFMLKGARHADARNAGFFPEFLRAEYHAFRKVLERYATTKAIAIPPTGETLVGAALSRGNHSRPVRVRVSSRGVTTSYTLDRWE